MLSVRNTIKEDIGCTAAELVFGSTLRLPGEMILTSSTTGQIDVTSYAARLRQHMQALTPTPTRYTSKHTHIPADLHTCDFVFVRIDAVRKPLQPPYEGPFRVVRRNAKFFIIDRHGSHASISIDRLKVAYVERAETSLTNSPSSPPLPAQASHLQPPSDSCTDAPSTHIHPQHSQASTRTGRQLKLPVRFRD